jgi:CRP-like cAMP-binding protein
MHFILDGRVGIMIPTGEGGTTRVRSLGRCTTIGEMGLVSRSPRSATIQAEVASTLYVLRIEQFEAIKEDDPALGQKLLTYFVSIMAERLTFANRMIACCGGRVCARPRIIHTEKDYTPPSSVFDLDMFFHVMRTFAAQATFLNAAEGRDFGGDETGIDADHAGLQRFRDPPDPAEIARIEV